MSRIQAGACDNKEAEVVDAFKLQAARHTQTAEQCHSAASNE